MTDTAEPTAAPADSPRGLLLLPRRVLAAAALVAAFTLYMAVVTVSWALHMGSLRATSDELEQRRVEASAAAEEDRAAAQALQDELDEAHYALLLSANRATQADDYALYLSYVGTGIGYCIDAKEDLAYYVRRKYSYAYYNPPQSDFKQVEDYENEVQQYCDDIFDALEEALAEVDEDLADPSPSPSPLDEAS